MVPADVLGVECPQLVDIDGRLPGVRLNHPLPHVDPFQLRISGVGLYNGQDRGHIKSMKYITNQSIQAMSTVHVKSSI